MIVTQAEPEFRPVTIVLETQDEYDKLVAVLGNVARNLINHTHGEIAAAKYLLAELTDESIQST
jgi:hypothetical protein